MREILNTLAKGSRALTPNKSNLRISAEKSSKLYIAPVAITAAIVLIMDAFATWKSNMR